MKEVAYRVPVRQAKYYNDTERKIIIEEYLEGGISKTEIWRKYTQQHEEHGHINRWMRLLGYDVTKSKPKLVSSSLVMKKQIRDKKIEKTILEERIKELEQALINSELRASAYDTMINIAEKELKINIRKKSYTKQSIKSKK
jgi:hypothetical protein